MSIEKISQAIKECKKCGLWRNRKNAVPGEGNKKAKVMIIGQAPGKEEDNLGRPFVGASGKFLNRALEKLGKNREKFFITSVIKCFPPKNRKPTKKEIEACLPYTIEQIKLIKPRFILIFGEVAAEALLNKKFKEIRGKFIEKDGIVFFVTFHPSAARRFKKIREKFFHDLKLFFRQVND
jgi:DNA polymerase